MPAPMAASWYGMMRCFGYTIGAEGDDLTFDERDSAQFMPKCVVVDPNFDWKGEPRTPPGGLGPDHPLRDPCARLHQAASRMCPNTSAALSPAWAMRR